MIFLRQSLCVKSLLIIILQTLVKVRMDKFIVK